MVQGSEAMVSYRDNFKTKENSMRSYSFSETTSARGNRVDASEINTARSKQNEFTDTSSSYLPKKWEADITVVETIKEEEEEFDEVSENNAEKTRSR